MPRSDSLIAFRYKPLNLTRSCSIPSPITADSVEPVTRLVFHLIPHTHWDREWYLSRARFGARLILMIDDLLARLEQDAGFRTFLLDGQAILAADYLAARPRGRAESRGAGPGWSPADRHPGTS